MVTEYQKRRTIQWGAFTSSTTSLERARGFAGHLGVVVKIDIATGKDICNLSFFHSEDEVLLSPNHRFMVTSDNGGTIDSHGYTVIELMEQDERQAWFRS